MVRANENPPQGTEKPDAPPPPEDTVKVQGEPRQPVTVEPPPINVRADIASPDKKG